MVDSTERAAYLTDYWTDVDALHFSDFCPALERILTTAQTPLTVGVFGTWGSGKTSLLRMLKKKVDRQPRGRFRTVWFTAWKYDRQEALWRTFILRVLDSLYPRRSGKGPWEERERIPQEELQEWKKRQVEQLDRLAQSVYGTVEWEELGQWVFDWKKAGKELAELLPFLLLLPFFPFGGQKIAEMMGIAPNLAEMLQREIHAHRLEQLASMERFEETFQQALKLVLGEGGRLVVFVDDLDRCLPEKAVEVLEAIKLFLEVPGTVFVLGMDPAVIERGIEARYGALFRRERAEGGQEGERPELPIRGDIYLQKIVQIPFYLPPLAVEDVGGYIQELEKALPEGAVRLTDMTREVFARGLFPNPRQVKRALNIFRLLQEIAREREERPEEEGGLKPGSVAWPLLAKTVCIQTQWPDLYQKWRQIHTLVQTLEGEYTRQPSTEEETLRGRVVPPLKKGQEKRQGGLLDEYLAERRRYALLEQMLTFPAPNRAGEGLELARFSGLSRKQMAVYVRLAGAMETAEPLPEVPADLWTEALRGDLARIKDAAARLEELEPEREGPRHKGLREPLQTVMRDPTRPAQERAGAGNALALVGDPRFRPDAWYLPDEPLLGFVEVPAGPFLMGTREEDIPLLMDKFGGEAGRYRDETPQHTIELPTYYMARYLVTVAQFRAFVEASGRKPSDEDSLRGLDNHPVVDVTWHDALAYCRWLTERLREWAGTSEPLRTLLRDKNWTATLPSEAEWEKAARGTDGRLFPWGEEIDPNRANCDGTGIGSTSAVGCFPGGASPYGCEDMSGNVWEWTRSLWGKKPGQPEFKYPYNPEDGREDLEAGDKVLRVLRGGSFRGSGMYVRCAARVMADPGDFGGLNGFRVVVASV